MATAISLSSDGIEWSTIKIFSDKFEIINQNSCKYDFIEKQRGIVSFVDLPNEITKNLNGDIYLCLPAYAILTNIHSFPSQDLNEIKNMSEFQIDKISPFPSDKLIIDFEILRQENTFSKIIIMATQRKFVDQFSDYSNKKNNLKIIDSRILGWLELINNKYNKAYNFKIILISDSIDTCILLINKKEIISIRPIYIDLSDTKSYNELSYEISYTLQLEDNESLNKLEYLDLWIDKKSEKSLLEHIKLQTGLNVNEYLLSELPPLSEGIILRNFKKIKKINLLPNYIANKQFQKNILNTIKKYTYLILIIWVIIFTTFNIIYNIRENTLVKLQDELIENEPIANIAKENYKKLTTLTMYSDRSGSALEALREITLVLPNGDIEFISYNYSKGKGISLRGTANKDDIVYEYFKNLANSKMFESIKNQSVTTRTINKNKRTVFSVSLQLSNSEGR